MAGVYLLALKRQHILDILIFISTTTMLTSFKPFHLIVDGNSIMTTERSAGEVGI